MGNIVTNYGVRAPAIVPDPGDAGAINPVSGTCPLVSAAAETRTLAIPTALNEELTLYCKTYVGDIVTTVASAINYAGHTIITLGTVDESITLRSAWNGSAYCWRVAFNDITGGSTNHTAGLS